MGVGDLARPSTPLRMTARDRKDNRDGEVGRWMALRYAPQKAELLRVTADCFAPIAMTGGCFSA